MSLRITWNSVTLANKKKQTKTKYGLKLSTSQLYVLRWIKRLSVNLLSMLLAWMTCCMFFFLRRPTSSEDLTDKSSFSAKNIKIRLTALIFYLKHYLTASRIRPRESVKMWSVISWVFLIVYSLQTLCTSFIMHCVKINSATYLSGFKHFEPPFKIHQTPACDHAFITAFFIFVINIRILNNRVISQTSILKC